MPEQNQLDKTRIANGIIESMVSQKYCGGDTREFEKNQRACYLVLTLGHMISQADDAAMTNIIEAAGLAHLSDQDRRVLIAEESDEKFAGFTVEFIEFQDRVTMLLKEAHPNG